MSSGERRKKKLSVFFKIPLLLGLFLAAITVLVYFIYWPVGVILTVFLVIYFIFTLYMYLNNSEILRREMLEFATSYGQMQGELLKSFDVPYALLDETGKIEWLNDAFAAAVHKALDYRRSITTIFPSVRRESLPKDSKDIRIQVEFEGSSFLAQIKKLNMDDLRGRENCILYSSSTTRRQDWRSGKWMTRAWWSDLSISTITRKLSILWKMSGSLFWWL